MHVSYFPAMLRVTRGREGGVGGEKGLSRGGGGGLCHTETGVCPVLL